MDIAFTGWQFDAMETKTIPVNNTLIGNYLSDSKKRINQYAKANNFFKAAQECELSVNLLEGLTSEVNWFKEKDASLKNDPAYKKQLQARQSLLATEQNLKTEYEKQFQHGDMNYWTKTINDIDAKTKAASAEGAMYRRLKAYLSLAFYSISNQLITGHQDADAQNFVNLYKYIDPTNSEAWYFSAILNARGKNAKATQDDLIKAVGDGFNDKTRLMQQPEFQQLGNQIDLAEIESKIK